eukprot:gnl/TRDRNA2_/TRDRNA2_178491_c0_seq1.p3 gnl/TRDRNA2_/TRDRNA2_178491_c0~~gnl/TRDRNA2_/TRDRNA2_178491_c0_seq1.p3  ORF type:complete len:107 (-),score=38.76 gnl/TRDRNA2_/TRDRNA2_178491_c0_seq1:145-465(-)
MAFYKTVILALFAVAFGEVPSKGNVLMPPEDHEVATRKQIVQHFLADHNQRVADQWKNKQDIQAMEDAKKLERARNAMAAADATLDSAKDEVQKSHEEVTKFKERK